MPPRTRRVVRSLAAALAHGVAPAAQAALPRATSDRPDDKGGAQVHVLYVVPRDAPDRELDTDGTIARAVTAIQRWLRTQTGDRELRLDTHGGELDVTFFRLATDDAVVASRGAFVREQIEEELYAAGFVSKLYVVYYDGTSAWSCGGGDPQPSFRGTVAAMYLRGTPPGAPPCAENALGAGLPGYFEFGLLHEIVHSLGFVPGCAPHALGDYEAGHVSDSPYDLMSLATAGRGSGRIEPASGGAACRPACELRVRGPGRVRLGTLACARVCARLVEHGSVVSLRAVPRRGARLVGWSGVCRATRACRLVIGAPATVTARFARRG